MIDNCFLKLNQNGFSDLFQGVMVAFDKLRNAIRVLAKQLLQLRNSN